VLSGLGNHHLAGILGLERTWSKEAWNINRRTARGTSSTIVGVGESRDARDIFNARRRAIKDHDHERQQRELEGEEQGGQSNFSPGPHCYDEPKNPGFGRAIEKAISYE
jgi:hypothetical protein